MRRNLTDQQRRAMFARRAGKSGLVVHGLRGRKALERLRLVSRADAEPEVGRGARALIRKHAMPGADLVAKHEGLVRRVAHSFARRFPGAQLDDLLQEGRMGLLRANQLYRKKAGAKFSTYAHHHIAKRIREAARSSHLIRIPEKKANKGMGTPFVRGKAGRYLLSNLATGGGIARAHASASIQQLFKRSRLPELERRVLTLRYLNGQLTHREAAKRLRKSTSTVHGIERRAFAHLRKASMRRSG